MSINAFLTHNDNVILKWDSNGDTYFAYHFLLVSGRGGLPFVEVFLGVVFVLPGGTTRESTVTLASRIKLSEVNRSALRPGAMPQASVDRWGPEFRLDTIKIRWIIVSQKKWYGYYESTFIIAAKSKLEATEDSIDRYLIDTLAELP